MIDFALTDQVVFVTGASRGIGAAIANELARAGAHVAVGARHVAELKDISQRIEQWDRRSLAVELDVTVLPSIQAAVQRVEDRLGAITVLVNNAGVNIPRPAIEVTEEQWDCILDTNLKGAFFCAQEVGRRMIVRHSGKIINIASAAGLIPAADRAAYCSSKAGIIMLTRELALEWASCRITVNAVAPTFIETELAAQTLDRPGMRAYWANRIPLGRIASVDDVASAVRYLASPAADFITGAVIPVDGGLTMR